MQMDDDKRAKLAEKIARIKEHAPKSQGVPGNPETPRIGSLAVDFDGAMMAESDIAETRARTNSLARNGFALSEGRRSQPLRVAHSASNAQEA